MQLYIGAYLFGFVVNLIVVQIALKQALTDSDTAVIFGKAEITLCRVEAIPDFRAIGQRKIQRGIGGANPPFWLSIGDIV